MPPEPLPWDRKDFFKERKHERSSESLGSVARWKDSSHHGTREFNRWGSADFRRPLGHGKQGGWHLFSEDSGHGYVPSRSGDKMLEDDSCRPSISRGDGKYGRSIRENRFSQRDWKGHSWETSNGSPITSEKLLDVSNNDLRFVDDTITCLSHPNSDFVNTWDQLQLKDQHDKMGAVSGLGTGQRCDAENSVSSTDWKPLKWSRSGSLSSRGSGFSHSSSSKSMGGTDSNDTKADIQLKNSTPVQSLSGDAAACVTSAALSEETTSKKKPRLGWGEGLAKYEKKKVEGPDVTVNKDGAVVSACNAEPTQSFISNMADKSPRVAGFSDCGSPATPSSVACSSSPGVEEKSFGKAMNIDNDISNLCVSPCAGSIYLPEGFPFSLEKLDMNLIANLGSSLVELLQSEDSSSVDSSFVRSTAMNKLLLCKGEVSKALEVTESEIDLLENELKLLKSETENGEPCPAGSSSLPMEKNATPCKGQDGVSNLFPRPEQLQISSANTVMEKMPLCNGALEDIHAAIKDEDMDSPGTATSKFVEPLSLVKADSLSDKLEHGDSSGNLDEIQIESENMVVKYSVPGSVGENTGTPVSSEVRHTDQEDRLCDSILASNRECANRACGVFSKLLPRDQHVTDVSCTVHFLSCQSSALMKEKFAMRKQFLRFKERVLTIKFKVFQHLWKEDARLLSVRKQRPKSQKKFDLSLRTALNGNQKHRSSLLSRCASPGNLSLVPTTEMINFTSKLLSDSQVKIYRNTLKMPSLILDKNERMMSRFISSNGLVEDPCAVEKERAVINPWMPIEREIFMKKLSIIGKDFRKIASFLDHKTTADCVEFYYKNHKSDCFEKSKKQDCSKQMKAFFTDTYMVTSEKKRIREINAASLEKFGKSSMMVACADDHVRSQHSSAGRLFLGGYGDSKPSWDDDGILDRSSSLGFIGNESDTVIADALTGMCGSLSSEAMSSCITSSVDPGESNREWKCQKVDSLIKRPLTPDVTQNVDDETCSDESCGEMDPSDWTDEEKSIFIQAVSTYGKDFVMISRCVRTRSRDQCKAFFSKARKCLGLDLMHPGPRNVGVPVSDDPNGGGSDTEDACVVETASGSVICGKKLGCKLDDDLPLTTMNTNHDESDPAKIVNLQSDLNSSEENNGMGHMDQEDFEAVETLVSDACQAENSAELVVQGDNNVVDTAKNQSDSVNAQRSAVFLANSESRGDQVIEQGILISESVSNREGINPGPLSSGVLVENKAVTSVGYENELGGQRLLLAESSLNNKQHEASDRDATGLQSSIQDSNTAGNVCHPAADSSSGFCLNPEYQHKFPLELDSLEKPRVIPLPQQNSLATATLLSQDSASILCDKTLNQDRSSSTLDFHGNRDKQSPRSFSREDFHQHLPGHPILNHVESSQILRGYPLHVSKKKEMNGDISCRKLSEAQTLSQSGKIISTRFVAKDCSIQKCSSSKPHSSVAELPLLSQKIEQDSFHSRSHSRSLSDTDKPCRNGDVKLFGQILTHPSSMQKSNSGTHENGEKGIQDSKLSSKLSNLKFPGHHQVDGNILKFDHNYLGLENVAMSYGYWDGNRIQTRFSSFADSAVLLAKCPGAFGNCPTPPSKIEPPPLQAVVNSNERNSNGVSVFQTREISSNDGVVDYQVYGNREGSKMQPFAVDMKQRHDIHSEMQRRNGLEAVSSLQPQAMGVVGMDVVGRGGVLVGGPCTGVSDPVAAIKMHYAKSDQYGGKTGSIVREEEPWRGKGGIGR
ncbi:uncharacterized protein LOC121246299 isoform X2 [Juglans microcarpa x Juglans regia]|uniref:uncharacterized protein LOC121246299 isoform X2 n=1 Tax=Juglans microcarpa x Juglans regia TaxID=2249226 RepID=UPI001B7E8238|nr:uncharacterized protein LOC121246299 isoform X2 [Juglans microcarpa x Juglans regia]